MHEQTSFDRRHPATGGHNKSLTRSRVCLSQILPHGTLSQIFLNLGTTCARQGWRNHRAKLATKFSPMAI